MNRVSNQVAGSFGDVTSPQSGFTAPAASADATDAKGLPQLNGAFAPN